MRRLRGHIKEEAVMVILAAFFALVICFVLMDVKGSIRKWWYGSTLYELDEYDSLSVESIGPQYSEEKESQIRQLNEHMAEFLNVYDVE